MELESKPNFQIIHQAVVERFHTVINEFHGQASITIYPHQLLDAALMLRDEAGFNLLSDITAVDYFPQEPRFHVVYQFNSIQHSDRITLRVPVSGQDPQLDTMENIFPGANWYEREIMDMFGIKFIGHSNPRRIILPEDWVGHPLRKDHPLGYEEVEFTFNFNEIDQRKPKGDEFNPGVKL